MVNQLDFNPQANELLTMVSDIFTNDSNENINYKIILLRSEIEKIIMILQEALNEGPNRKQARKNLTNILKTSYQLIMEIRNKIVGENQSIHYRLYLKEGTTLKVFDIPENKLMELVERSGDTLRLRRSFIEIDKAYINNDIKNYIDNYFSQVYNSFDPPSKGKKGYTVQMSVIGQYGDPPNLVWPIDLNGRGKSWRTPKIFNLGWIYQAFDATVYDLYNVQRDEMLSQVTQAEFHRSYFVEHLKYDNVVGFKGGDVGLNQIKGNMASLMNAKTILKYLNYIKDILTPQYFQNKEKMKQFILEKFSDTSTSINSELNTNVSQSIDYLSQFLNIS